MSVLPSRSSPVPIKFQKGAQVIMARGEGDDFTLLDRKVVNVLLANAYSNIMQGKKMHHIRLADLANALLMDFEPNRSGDQFMLAIRGSLDRLWSRKITIDFTDNHGIEHTLKCHYLSFSISKLEATDLFYAFDEVLMTFLGHPKVYGVIDLEVSAKMRSPYGHRLYEVMKMCYHRRHPVWDTSVAEFREFFEIGDKYERFDFMRKHVIEKAVDEVNTFAEFNVEVDYERSGRGGKVDLMTFRCIPKPIEAFQTMGGAAATGKQLSRDVHTIDLFDGLTDVDKTHAPDLSEETIRVAAELLGDEQLVMVKREKWFEDIGAAAHRRPDEKFLIWLRADIKAQSMPALASLDVGSLIGRLIGGKED